MELKSYISARGVSFRYSEKPVLDRINFTIPKGEVVTILGPNGSGKSTLLKIMLGLLRPERGVVLFKGKNIKEMGSRGLAREIAYVPQGHVCAFPYSVIDVVLMGRIPHRSLFIRYSREDLDIAYDALDRLSISHLAEKAYTEISGGERQLAIIARALTQGANMFIMDEPAAGLDYGNQLRLLEEIGKLAGNGYTFIVSTHSPEHALWISDRVIMIRRGSVFANGSAKDVITGEALNSLFKIKVSIENVNGSASVCVPQRVCGCEGVLKKAEQNRLMH